MIKKYQYSQEEKHMKLKQNFDATHQHSWQRQTVSNDAIGPPLNNCDIIMQFKARIIDYALLRTIYSVKLL